MSKSNLNITIPQRLILGRKLFINELTDFCLCDPFTLEEHKGETGLISLFLQLNFLSLRGTPKQSCPRLPQSFGVPNFFAMTDGKICHFDFPLCHSDFPLCHFDFMEKSRSLDFIPFNLTPSPSQAII